MTTATHNIPTRIAKGTIYVQGDLGFGYGTIEATDIEISVGRYAQYDNAVKLTFLPKRARRRRQITLSYDPKCVVVEGWGHPKFDSFAPPSQSGSVFVREGLHSACSPKWSGTFAKFLSANGLTAAVDFHGWNSYSGGWPERSSSAA